MYLLYLSRSLIFMLQKKSTHYLIMKIQSKKELQNIASNHSANIDYKDFMNI